MSGPLFQEMLYSKNVMFKKYYIKLLVLILYIYNKLS